MPAEEYPEVTIQNLGNAREPDLDHLTRRPLSPRISLTSPRPVHVTSPSMHPLPSPPVHPLPLQRAKDDDNDEVLSETHRGDGDGDSQRTFEKDTRSESSANFRSQSSEMYEIEDGDSTVHATPSHPSSERRAFNFGLRLPLWCSSPPSMTRMSYFIVRHAPCFWCSSKRLEWNATDRSILQRLTVLCGVFALGQVGSAIFFLVALHSSRIVDREAVYEKPETHNFTPNLWNLNGSIFSAGFIGAVLFVTVLTVRRSIAEVNLVGALRFMWCLLWIIPAEIYLVICLFDYHQVTTVWVKHWWAVPSMAWFRSKTCAHGTFNEECLVPIEGSFLLNGTELIFLDEAQWCKYYFDWNVNVCSPIRDQAQETLERSLYIFYIVNGVWGVLLIVMLLLTVDLLEGIITKPIVQSSRESNVPAWLTLPILGCTATGAILLFSPSSVLSGELGADNAWIGVVYMISGGLFFVAALLGWFISAFSILSNRDKRNKNIAVLLFIAVMMVTVVAVGTIFTASIILSVNLVQIPMTDEQRGDIACYIDSADSCSFCDIGNRFGFSQCPEWTVSDVVKVLQTQLKQSAALAAIFFLYALAALRFGFLLRKHISMYQIDYV